MRAWLNSYSLIHLIMISILINSCFSWRRSMFLEKAWDTLSSLNNHIFTNFNTSPYIIPYLLGYFWIHINCGWQIMLSLVLILGSRKLSTSGFLCSNPPCATHSSGLIKSRAQLMACSDPMLESLCSISDAKRSNWLEECWIKRTRDHNLCKFPLAKFREGALWGKYKWHDQSPQT